MNKVYVSQWPKQCELIKRERESDTSLKFSSSKLYFKTLERYKNLAKLCIAPVDYWICIFLHLR